MLNDDIVPDRQLTPGDDIPRGVTYPLDLEDFTEALLLEPDIEDIIDDIRSYNGNPRQAARIALQLYTVLKKVEGSNEI